MNTSTASKHATHETPTAARQDMYEQPTACTKDMCDISKKGDSRHMKTRNSRQTGNI